MEDVIKRIENREFLTLTAADAEILNNHISSAGGSANALEETKAAIGDPSIIKNQPWFVPYLLLTANTKYFSLSPVLKSYLAEYPVVPEKLETCDDTIKKKEAQLSRPKIHEKIRLSPYLSENSISEKAPPLTTTVVQHPDDTAHLPITTTPVTAPVAHSLSPNVVAPEKCSVIKQDVCERVKKEVSVPHTTTDSLKPEKLTQSQNRKRVKIKLPDHLGEMEKTHVQCFKIVMDFVSKPTVSIDQYFRKVVLPFALQRNAQLAHCVSESSRASLDSVLGRISAHDGGITLREVGYEMIGTVLRALSKKYGDAQVQKMISTLVNTYGNGRKGTLGECYKEMFSSNPTTLQAMLSSIKSSIAQFKHK